MKPLTILFRHSISMNPRLLHVVAALLIVGCQQSDKAVPTPHSTSATANSENLLGGIELKHLSDLDAQIKDIHTLGIEAAARKIAQIDEWLYSPDDEKAARARIDSEIDKFRSRIEAEIAKLTIAAIEAATGKLAAEKMAKINLLLQLYPTPNTDAQRSKLEQLSTSILSASRRVEDIRRLRYNEWAIARIQSGLNAYRDELKVKRFADVLKLVKHDRDALITNSVTWMSPIDPLFLEPSVMDLYNYVFGLTRDAMGSDDESRIKLTQGFVNSKSIRKTPADF